MFGLSRKEHHDGLVMKAVDAGEVRRLQHSTDRGTGASRLPLLGDARPGFKRLGQLHFYEVWGNRIVLRFLSLYLIIFATSVRSLAVITLKMKRACG